MNPEEAPPPTSSRRPWLVVGSLVALLAVGALVARPVYLRARTWRADKLAAEAEGAIQKQNWPEAQQKAQAAYHLAPTSPNSIRVVARLYTLAGRPNALAFWRSLRETGQATAEDRRELVRAALRSGKGPEVREEALALASDRDTESVRLAAEFCVMTGDRTNGLRFARELVGLEKSGANDLVLAKAELASGDPALQGPARATLNSLARGTNTVALEAEVVLARSGLASDAQLPDLIERLSHHPLRRLSHRLLAEDLRLRFEPQNRAASVGAFVNEVAGSGLTNRIEVARWLNRLREFPRTTNLIAAAEAHDSRDAFLVRIDALAGLGEWKIARAELEADNAPIESVLREVYLARTARELGQLPEAEAHWRRVQLELGSHPEALYYVADYAERVGEKNEARKAYDRLTAFPEFADQAYTGLIRIAEQEGGTRTLREIMRDLSARQPDNPAPQNDFAYLNLLLNERVDASKEIAEKLYEAHPNVMAYRTTLALARLRLGEITEAQKLYADLNIDWSRLQPGWQAVHAAVVASAGQTNFARTLVRPVPLDQLKPEEKALIQGLL